MPRRLLGMCMCFYVCVSVLCVHVFVCIYGCCVYMSIYVFVYNLTCFVCLCRCCIACVRFVFVCTCFTCMDMSFYLITMLIIAVWPARKRITITGHQRGLIQLQKRRYVSLVNNKKIKKLPIRDVIASKIMTKNKFSSMKIFGVVLEKHSSSVFIFLIKLDKLNTSNAI